MAMVIPFYILYALHGEILALDIDFNLCNNVNTGLWKANGHKVAKKANVRQTPNLTKI